MLSFPTQGELSVPCCLLNICNRCKYLLLIYSLKELQSSVCVCVSSVLLQGLGVLPAALLLLSPGDTSSLRLLLCPGGALGAGQGSAAQDLLSKGKELPKVLGELRSVGELGNQESCKEWMSGRCCCCSLLPLLSP